MSSRPQAVVHLPNIARNWKRLDEALPDVETAGVVKANAYGLGAAQVARALAGAGCKTFFVAYAFEGEVVRRALGHQGRIYVLNGPVDEDLPLYKKHDLIPVLNGPEQYRIWHHWHEGGAHLPYALHFDTGMNRLGFRVETAEELFRVTEAVPPLLVMSHLACAEAGQGGMNAQQKARFRDVLAWFTDTPASLANSAGIGLGDLYGMTLTRPGIALFGGGAGMDHAVTLTAPILSVWTGRAGESVGYNATHRLSEETRLATVALGYADGMLRSGSGKLIAYLDGAACPVLGRISMDLITIDVSRAQDAVKAGRRVEFLGQHAKLDEQAARAGTIGYELLTGLNERVERIYETS